MRWLFLVCSNDIGDSDKLPEEEMVELSLKGMFKLRERTWKTERRVKPTRTNPKRLYFVFLVIIEFTLTRYLKFQI